MHEQELTRLKDFMDHSVLPRLIGTRCVQVGVGSGDVIAGVSGAVTAAGSWSAKAAGAGLSALRNK